MITISFEQAAAYLQLRMEFSRRCPGAPMPPSIEKDLLTLDKKASDHLLAFAPKFIDYHKARLAEMGVEPKEPA